MFIKNPAKNQVIGLHHPQTSIHKIFSNYKKGYNTISLNYENSFFLRRY